MIKREFFISDIHHPYSNKAAWNVVLKAAQIRKPDLIHIGGDGMDFHSISRHPKQQIEKTFLRYEIDESKIEWQRLRSAAPNAKINYQEGNHDARMRVYLRDRAPELADLDELRLESLLGFEELGFEFIEESAKYRVGKLWHHHGHLLPGSGKSVAKAKFLYTHQNLIFGHHHVHDYYSVRQYGSNRLLQSIANAMLYTIEPEYAHHTNWNLGFTEINYATNGEFNVMQYHINSEDEFASDDAVHYTVIEGEVIESHAEENIDLKLLRSKPVFFSTPKIEETNH